MQSFREAFLNKDPAEKMFAYFAVLVRVANRPAEEKSIGGCFDEIFGNESPDVFFQFCPLTIPHEAVSLLNFVDKFEAFFQYFGQMVTVVVVHRACLETSAFIVTRRHVDKKKTVRGSKNSRRLSNGTPAI